MSNDHEARPTFGGRREFLVGAGAAMAGVYVTCADQTAIAGSAPPPTTKAKLTAEAMGLKLRHTWTTVMSSSATRDTILCRYSKDGITGIGEGAPIKRYAESAQEAIAALDSGPGRAIIEGGDPWRFTALLGELFSRVPGQFALKAAISGAIADWIGQRLGLPLYRYFGLDPDKAPITTMSLGIDTPEITRQKTREAAEFPVLKVKVGLDSDETTIEAVRSVTKKPLRVDANEGWKSKEQALAKINWLAERGVELCEQPLPAAMIEETRWLRGKARIPIFADEACKDLTDIPRLAEAYDGVNIKLDKCGGIFEALRMIHAARAHKLKVMLGCMISSSVAIAAAAHLSPLVDCADLDGGLLIANDPYRSMTAPAGKIRLPDRPGLGLVAVAENR